MEKVGLGVCNGSFGELLQGVLPGKRKFLVNLKIKNTSRVRVHLTPCVYSQEKEAEYALGYQTFPKTYKVLRNILTDLGLHDDCHVEVSSEIPVGKGLSSSTADMVAGIRATAQALSVALKPEYTARVISEIEPNDGLHYPGTAAYHHTLGRLIFCVNFIPPFRILGIDCGYAVDTIQFNAREFDWQESEMENYARLLEQLEQALIAADLKRIGEISTESARRWQRISGKNELDAIIQLGNETKALGVVNAHSGAYLGLLYEHDGVDESRTLAAARECFADHDIRWFETVSMPA